MQINLSDELTKKLEARVDASDEFQTVEEYVEYIVTEVLKQTETQEPEGYTKDQEKELKQRLSDLGYLD